MYCKKCGKELENDALFCSSCGAKTNNATEDDPLTPEQLLDNNEPQTNAEQEDNNCDISVNAKKKPKVKIVVSCIIILSIVLSILIPTIVKNSRVNDVPNYYFDFGMQGTSNPVGSPNEKTFFVDVVKIEQNEKL